MRAWLLIYSNHFITRCTAISTAATEGLLRLLSDEVAAMDAGKTPSYRVASLQRQGDNGEAVHVDMVKIEHNFELGAVKRHIKQRIETLRA